MNPTTILVEPGVEEAKRWAHVARVNARNGDRAAADDAARRSEEAMQRAVESGTASAADVQTARDAAYEARCAANRARSGRKNRRL